MSKWSRGDFLKITSLFVLGTVTGMGQSRAATRKTANVGAYRPKTPKELYGQLNRQGLCNGVAVDIVETNPGQDAIRIRMKEGNEDNLAALTVTLKQIQNTIERGMLPADKLVIVAGEEHETPSHMAIQSSLIAMNERCIFGLEHPVNAIALIAKNKLDLELPSLAPEDFKRADPKGELFAKIYSMTKWHYAGFSHAISKQTAVNNGSIITLNDAPISPGGMFLDLKYPSSGSCAKELFPEQNLTNRRISPIKRKGMDIRNCVMAKGMLETLFSKSTKVAVAQIGLDHPLGAKKGNLSFNHSYIAQIHNKAAKNHFGLRTMCVLPTTKKNIHKIFPAGKIEKNTNVIIENFNKKRLGSIQYPNDTLSEKRILEPLISSFYTNNALFNNINPKVGKDLEINVLQAAESLRKAIKETEKMYKIRSSRSNEEILEEKMATLQREVRGALGLSQP